jgi:prepilin-type N-terminal cleavage/methylation domain-containing protein
MGNRGHRGFTLVELMTALAISAVLLTLVVSALVGLARERAVREVATAAQEEARFGFSVLSRDIRAASLGSPSGVVWAHDATGNRVSRPTVQIYDDVAGGGLLGAKPNTDALLVVQALSTFRAAAVGDHFDWTQPLKVTSTDGFAMGTRVLFGEYADAGWATVTGVDADPADQTLTLSGAGAENLYPGQGGKLPSGSLVRPAMARLYYVSLEDELVRVDLASPWPLAALGPREVLATSYENLQIGCQLDRGGGLEECGAGVASPDPLAADATPALGVARARVAMADAALLRLLQLNAVVHGKRPLRDYHGDGPIDLAGNELSPAGAAEGDAWFRRAYQLQLAIRNTSLEAL